MRINNNLMAINTHRQYTMNNNKMAAATKKLSSGYRINSASDDAAGLAISEKMRAQIRGLEMASKNSEDAISLVQTAEGALQETDAILQRMRELAVQSASDTNEDTVDRVALQAEYTQLISEMDDIANDTTFNDMKLLDGSFGVSVDQVASTIYDQVGVASVTASGEAGETYTFEDLGANLVVSSSDGTSVTFTGGTMAAGAQTLVISQYGITVELTDGFTAAGLNGATIVMGAGTDAQIQTGANNGQNLSIQIGNMTSTALGVNTSSISSRTDAEAAITTVNTALNNVSAERAKLGAYQNRLDHKINNLDTASENLTAAESRIRDIDMAAEMTQFTQTSILVQAATSMLAQANAAPQNVLSLLQ